MTKKIMIIDDNQTNLKMMDLVLSKAGFKTDTVINPTYAIDVIRDAKPDLILLDINMPEINGFQICKKLKKDPELMYIPIIFVSALEDTKYIAGGLALGAVDYITKPIKVDELLARVSVQLKIAYAQGKMRRTNDLLQKQVTEEFMENSDMQQDLLYSLMQIKNGENNDKNYERIRDFCSFIIKKTIEDSPYNEELSEDFVNNILKESFIKCSQ